MAAKAGSHTLVARANDELLNYKDLWVPRCTGNDNPPGRWWAIGSRRPAGPGCKLV